MTPDQRAASLPHVDGEVVYLAKMAEKPHTYAYDLPPGQPRTNMIPDPRVMPMHDMRPVAANLSLDVEGYELHRAPTAVPEKRSVASSLARL